MSIRKLYSSTSYIFIVVLFSGLSFFTCTSSSNKTDIDSHTIFLVRHAEKADDGTKDPPLTQEGEERALALAELLKDEQIQKIYSTDYKRTRSTAEPLSKLLNIDIEIYDPNDEGFVKILGDGIKNSNILVVGHSNSTPKLVNQVMDFNQYQQLDESVYDQIFKITLDTNGKLSAKTETFHSK